MHGFFPRRRRFFAMQQVQEVAADRVVVRFHFDALAVMAIVVPVQQHGAERRHQAVGDVARAWRVMVVFFRQGAAQHGHARAHHVHRVGGGGQGFQRGFDGGRQAAQGFQFGLVAFQFRGRRQLAMHQQVGDFLELAAVGHVQDVIAR